MFCSKCGAENADDNAFCKECGNAIQHVEKSTNPSPQSTPSPNNVKKPSSIKSVLKYLFISLGVLFVIFILYAIFSEDSAAPASTSQDSSTQNASVVSETSDLGNASSDPVSADEKTPDGNYTFEAAMQSVKAIYGANSSKFFFYDDGNSYASLLKTGDLAILVDDEGYDKVDCYVVAVYKTERTEENRYQPEEKYYVPMSTGLPYKFNFNDGTLELQE